MILTGEQILKARDKKTATVPVPEWGEGAEVLIGSMGAMARVRLAEWFNTRGTVIEREEKDGKEDEEPRIVTCDSATEKGEPLEPAGEDTQEQIESAERRYSAIENTEFMLMYLAESILDPQTQLPAFTAGQVKELGQKDPKPLRRIYEAALKFNIDTKDSIGQAEKNSGRTAGTDSGGG